jgi:hypothetical protein
MIRFLSWFRIILISTVYAVIALFICVWFTFGVSFGNPHGWWANGIGHFLSGLILFVSPVIVFIVSVYRQIKK